LSFGGYLYGLSEGHLYQLDGRTYSSTTWKWIKCIWAPVAITWISSTLTGSHLWLQTANSSSSSGNKNSHRHNREVGYLYSFSEEKNRTPKQVQRVILSGKKRIYGLNEETYLEVDLKHYEAVKMPSKQKISNIITGALTYDGDIIRIPKSLGNVIYDVRIVHWEPHFISKE